MRRCFPATVTIIDDDPAPSIAINDVTLAEGNAGTTAFNFTVTLSAASSANISVDYATANGSAAAGSDYNATAGTLTILAGATTATITVPVIGDTAIEPNETFFVNLTNPQNASIADSQGLGTITNDDTPVAAGVPTMSGWMLIALALALALIGGASRFSAP
jgi:large repetitive protein